MASKYEFGVGERVFFTTIFNNPGQYKPGDKMAGTLIAVCGQSEPSYRIELDMVWSDRVHAKGQKIIVGNISSRSISLK